MAHGDALRRLSDALARADRPVSPRGRTSCPAHNGRNPDGLHIEQGDKGVVVTCHSRGCSHLEIAESVGLTESELFDNPGVPSGTAARAAVRGERDEPRGKLAGRWLHDTDTTPGEIRVLRFEPGRRGRSKRFVTQVRDKDATRGWRTLNREQGERIPPALLNLDDARTAIEAGAPLFIVGGEKCADAVRSLGLASTTKPGGEQGWTDAHTDLLRCQGERAFVVLVPDDDTQANPKGERFMRSVAESALRAGFAVRVVRGLRGAMQPHTGGDVADWVEAGRSAGKSTQELHDELISLVDASKPVTVETLAEWQPLPPAKQRRAQDTRDRRDAGGGLLALLTDDPLMDIAVASACVGAGMPTGFDALDTWGIRWNPGELTSLIARLKHGKTTFALNAACQVLEGSPSARVVFVSYELSRRELAARVLAREAARATDGTVCISIDDALRALRQIGGLGQVPALGDGDVSDAIINAWPRARELFTRLVIIDGRAVGMGAAAVTHALATLMREAWGAPPALVVCDYWQKLRAQRSPSRQRELAEVSESFLALAKGSVDPESVPDDRYAVPVLILAQANQEGERAAIKTSEYHPRAVDLRESEDLNNDASNVLALSRERGPCGTDFVRVSIERARSIPYREGALVRFRCIAGAYIDPGAVATRHDDGANAGITPIAAASFPSVDDRAAYRSSRSRAHRRSA